MTLHALHGFLGLPSDWTMFDTDVEKWDLITEESLESASMTDWGVWFSNQDQVKEEDILLGYSMGGRLALHALFQKPSHWKGAIFVSTHPGLTGEKERMERMHSDWALAKRFLTEEWDTLMEEWEAQELFRGVTLQRRESDYKRELLASSLFKWSLGLQQPFSHLLKQVDIPILWVVGEEDHKFVEVSNHLEFSNPKSKVWVVKGAGHRLPWSHTESFKEQVHQFMENL